MFYIFKKRDKTSVYNTLFTACYINSEGKLTDKLLLDMSFTYLDWNVIERLTNSELQCDDIEYQQVIETTYNILPGCETCLHKVWLNAKALEKLMAYSLTLDADDTIMDIPFIKNIQGKSPIHICLENEDMKSVNIMLTQLRQAHLQHHSEEIVDVFYMLIKKVSQNVLDYVDKRFV